MTVADMAGLTFLQCASIHLFTLAWLDTRQSVYSGMNTGEGEGEGGDELKVGMSGSLSVRVRSRIMARVQARFRMSIPVAHSFSPIVFLFN